MDTLQQQGNRMANGLQEVLIMVHYHRLWSSLLLSPNHSTNAGWTSKCNSMYVLYVLLMEPFWNKSYISISHDPSTLVSVIHLFFSFQQENHQRVSIFFDYAKRDKNTAWSYFLPMLNRQDLFTVHMVNFQSIKIWNLQNSIFF